MGCEQSSPVNPGQPKKLQLQGDSTLPINSQINSGHNKEAAQSHKESQIIARVDEENQIQSKILIDKKDKTEQPQKNKIIAFDPIQDLPFAKITVANLPDAPLKLQLGELREPIYKVKGEFMKKKQKMIKGDSTQRNNATKQEIPVIQPSDCLDNICLVSLSDGNWCHTTGECNCNDWWVEAGTVAGIEAYKIHPHKSAYKDWLLSRHCVAFNLPQAKNYSVYKIENQSIAQVAEIKSEQVKPNDWNLVINVTVSDLASFAVYFVLPHGFKLPPQLSPKTQPKKSKIPLMFKQQKLLSGEYSKESERPKILTPIIKKQDCFEKFGIVSLEDDWSRWVSTHGDHNCRNWIVEKCQILGVEAYRVHPPLLKSKKELGSRHCVSFFLTSKEDFNVYAIEKDMLQQVSFISANDVKLNEWNLQTSLVISQISNPIIYFLYPSDKKLPSQFAYHSIHNSKGLHFEVYCQKMLAGKSSKQYESKESKIPLFKPADCLLNFGVASLSNVTTCYSDGRYNYSNWKVEKGTLLGVEMYRVQPPKSPPIECLCSQHCVAFKLYEKKDYVFYRIQDGLCTQVSHLSAEEVKPNDWNLVTNLLVSLITTPAIFFAIPLEAKIPIQLTPKLNSSKVAFVSKYQKLLTGSFSVQYHKQKNVSPFIFLQDCFEKLGILSLENDYSRYCFHEGEYNYNNFLISKGILGGMEAYKVFPPLSRPTKQLGSSHCIAYLLQEKTKYNVYRIKQNGYYTQVGSIFPDEVKVGEYNPIKNISISQITSPQTFLLLKQSDSQSYSFPSLRQEYQPYSIDVYQKNYFLNKNTSDPHFAKLLTFIREDQKFFTGKFSKQKSNNGLPSPLILPPDCFYSIGVMCLTNQKNDLNAGGEWNANDWIIEKGRIQNTLAFRIHPPMHPPTSTYATFQHCLIIKFPTKQNHLISKVVEGFSIQVREVQASQITPNTYLILKDIKISEITEPLTLIIQKATNKISSYAAKNSIQSAIIYQNSQIKIKNYKVRLPEGPHTPSMFDYGPATWQCIYPINRRFFVFYLPSQNKQITVWSNHDDTIITMTQFDVKKMEVKHIRLTCKKGFILASAVGNDQHLYYTIVQPGKAGNVHWSRQMYIIKADINTSYVVKQSKLPTDKDNLNIYNFNTSHLVLSGNSLALFVSRSMTQAHDGLNHQGGYITVINTDTLQMGFKSVTSSHSFGNSLMVRKDGRFFGMDQGDVGPRGINYWIFDNNRYTSKIVYNFKTHHGTEVNNPAGNPYPLFEQISTKQKKFYKWSNDNNTYTQIAAPGVHEAEDGLYFFFTGQNLPQPLDSSYTNGSPLCGTRNIGYIKTRKQICQNLSDFVLTKGPTYKSSYYQFSGRLQPQQVTGVQWITNLANDENISRLKTCLMQNKMLLIYEIWNKKHYLRTEYMLVNLADGKYTVPKKLPSLIRLYRSDDMFYNFIEGSAVIMCGGEMNSLNRFEISLL